MGENNAFKFLGIRWMFPARETVLQPCCWIYHCLSSHGEGEGTVNLDHYKSTPMALLWSQLRWMCMGWLWTSTGVPAMSPQQAGGLRDLAVLLLCFLCRLWCLSWAVCCYCYMAKEDKSTTIQFMTHNWCQKSLTWFTLVKEVWITWVIRKSCSILMTFFCLSTSYLARSPKCNEHHCQSTAGMFTLQDEAESVQLLRDFFRYFFLYLWYH